MVFLCSCATTEQVTTTSNPIGPKTGKARSVFILGIPVSTKGQVDSAKKVGITTISTTEVRRTRCLFFGFRTFVVNGN
ncbi:MAG: hypothetical protein QM724_04215 [Flavobacteriales bacterium]